MPGLRGGAVSAQPLTVCPSIHLRCFFRRPGSVIFTVPAYQTMLILLEVLMGALAFRELEHLSGVNTFGFCLGISMAIGGLLLLGRGGNAAESGERKPLKSKTITITEV